ncbi:hypothetical protein EON65_52210 [archaeon]|nr:MAG: hypothetical protein EON65_52210 [archaeon]
MDVYIDQKQRIWVLDFNPFGEPTCSLLFDWAELLQHAESAPQSSLVRVVESQAEVLQSTAGRHRGPVDVHLAEDFSRFLEVCKQQRKEEEEEKT